MFTFKKVPRVGRYRSFELDQTMIKIKKKEVGYLQETRTFSEDGRNWAIRLAVKKEKTSNDPAGFRWITLKYKPKSEEEGREFLKKYFKEITEKYDLYRFED